MPPRLRLANARVPQPVRCQRVLCQFEIPGALRHASTVTTPAPSHERMTSSPPPIARFPPSQPPSHRRPEYRRSQLLRQYTSVIRTTPLMVFFQHDNLQSVEWSAIRRELNKAMQKVDDKIAVEGRNSPALAPHIKIQIIQTSIFDVALRIVEYFRPSKSTLEAGKTPSAVDPATQTSAEINLAGSKDDPTLTHDLSRAAQAAVRNMKGKHELSTLLVGPMAVLSIPHMSPEHLKAAMIVLSPKAFGYPAPTRRANPDWHEFPVQNGLSKMNVLAARLDSQLFGVEQAKWVSSIEGGMDGLRSQLVMALQSMGSSITNTLEGAGKSLYLTLESRRSVLEDEQKGPSGEGEGEKKE
ncbi:mitochondrial 54S ribosomal protein uL10m [Aspergillus stella-maris]|uniref:mitochondrial 54S ribosomal protein uL10m n=1 Tax=Aspergillus stella-maris TaxID=1810926 RepID=UPI003CCD4554